MDDSGQFDNMYRAMSSPSEGNPNLGMRQFKRTAPSVRRPQVWMQPAQEAHGAPLGNSWKTTPMGLGRPVTPFSSSYMKPVVL